MKTKKSCLVRISVISTLILLIIIGLGFLLKVEKKDLDQEARNEAPGDFIALSYGWVH